MTAFAAALRREWARIRSNPALLAALTLVPALSLLLIAAMLSRGAIENLPVAVVDEAQTPASRALVDAIAAQGTLAIAVRTGNPAEAEDLLRRGAVWGYLVVPEDFGVRPPGAGAPLTIAYNASYLSVGALVERQMRRAALGALGEEARAAAAGYGLDIEAEALPGIAVHVLFNPQSSLEFYLEALLQPAILHLLAACLGAHAVASELAGGTLAAWRRSGGGSLASWCGKLAPYALAMAWWGAAWMVWLVGLRGWRMEGSLALAYGGQVALLVASLTLSAGIAAVTRRAGLAFSASALYAGSALAYSGGSLPTTGAPLPVVVWSEALPFTHYLRLQMDQFLGAPVAVDLPALALLLLYAAAGMALCLFGARRPA